MAKTKVHIDKLSASVMFSGYSRCAQVYFCVQLNVQMETWSHKETSDLKVTEGRCWQLGGPFANRRETDNPWKIYDVCIQNLTDGPNAVDGLNETDGQNDTCPSHLLPHLTCARGSCGHPVFCVSLCHYSTCCLACNDPIPDGLCHC